MPKSTDALLLATIDAAFKSITTTTLADSVLVPEQRDRFLISMEARAALLRDARRITMRSHKTNLDRFGFDSRVLEPPQLEGEEFTGETDPTIATNVLDAQKVRGRVKLSDEALRDNLARADFQNQLVDAIAEKSGADLEELLLAGDTTSGDPYLALLDGWLKKAANSVTGVASADFDNTDPEAMFEAMIAATPKRFVANRERVRFWVTFDIENDYRDVLRARGTDLGDRAQTGAQPLAYKGVRIVDIPTMPAGRALLSDRDNTAYGIWEDIEVEPERKASFDRFDFHVRARADAEFEDENGATAADGYVGPA